jgi:hypothetical protein
MFPDRRLYDFIVPIFTKNYWQNVGINGKTPQIPSML